MVHKASGDVRFEVASRQRCELLRTREGTAIRLVLGNAGRSKDQGSNVLHLVGTSRWFTRPVEVYALRLHVLSSSHRWKRQR